ncbi:Sas10/Utp3/C1D family [Forsythia ovata]|uniref:Nuclear nucleic acid-binding protein C1D n=1 Tax=Forsythia ovata TaxID=205694 RepID=A0ABD1RNG9_9LAMI
METGSSSGGGGNKKMIPESVMEAVKRTSENMEEMKAHLEEFMSYCDADTLAKMEPLERAQALFLLAKATTTLFVVRLRCKGVNPDNHPVKKSLYRLNLYEEKLKQCMDLSKAPLRPSAPVNPQAATRFIEYSLPDLSPEQKQSMREISRGESTRIKYMERSVQRKRKYQSSEKQSVHCAAQEFLEKASRELLGENKKWFQRTFTT